jgi:peptidoglycan/LPS O-acetylase OafA/YrhL
MTLAVQYRCFRLFTTQEQQMAVQPSRSGPEGGHLPQLDGVRALAILLVLLAHSIPHGSYPLQLGASGVLLFFVLSGFLITGILLRAVDQAQALGHPLWRVIVAFYFRRFLRIFPLYYAVLFLAAVAGVEAVRRALPWHVTFLSNVHTARLGRWPGGGTDPLWSLSVEEQFYLCWPALVLFLPRRASVPILICALVGGPLSRFVVYSVTSKLIASQVLTPSCMDSLGMGALLAFLHHRGKAGEPCRRWLRISCLCLGLGLYSGLLALGLAGWGYRPRLVLEHTAYMALSTWLIDRAATGFRGILGSVLEFRPVVYVGTISYDVYLLHSFVPEIQAGLSNLFGPGCGGVPDPGLAKFLVMSTGAVALAAASWHFFEKPINDLKRYFPYVPRRKLIAVPAETTSLPIHGGAPIVAVAQGTFGDEP